MTTTAQYATEGRNVYLPPPALTKGQMYSVPRLDGLYDYYQGPPGTTPPQNDDYPVPRFAHPNAIGVASIALGRALDPRARKVGTGDRAIGSVTAMPGAALPVTMGGGLSGAVEAFSAPSAAAGMALFALAAAATAYLVRKARRA